MTSHGSNDLVIVVPTLNCEADIEKTIRELLPVVQRAGIPFEIVAVNDGSTDQTGAIIDRLAAKIPEMCTVHHDSPQGGGASFAEVLRATRARYITVIPGDNAFDATSLQSVFASVGQADLIISYRTNQRERTTRRSFFFTSHAPEPECDVRTEPRRLSQRCGLSAAVEKYLDDHLSIRRLGKPEDVAGVVAFLCSEQASYVAGAVVAVDGGWM